MGHIGICEYVIGVIHDKEIWYYVGAVSYTHLTLPTRSSV